MGRLLWWEDAERLRSLLWPLAVAAMLVMLLPGCERVSGYSIYGATPFDEPVDSTPSEPAHPDESEKILDAITVDDKAPVAAPAIHGPVDLDAITNWNHEAAPDHMPSGVEVDPPRGWIEFCLNNPNDPGCTP